MVKCVVALGNPGVEYSRTRHNIAWQLLEFLPFFPEIKWKKKYLGRWGTVEVGGGRLFVLKPETYMNLSGNGVSAMVKDYGFAPEELLIIHDDIELNFGVVSFKINGGLAGHNGLRSIASRLKSRDFSRFRLGISRPMDGDITEHVLSNFSPEEHVNLPRYLKMAAELLNDALITSVESAIQKYGKMDLSSL